jgi:hypothetical protein
MPGDEVIGSSLPRARSLLQISKVPSSGRIRANNNEASSGARRSVRYAAGRPTVDGLATAGIEPGQPPLVEIALRDDCAV